MKIQLKKGPRAAFEEIEVEKGTTIEAIYKKIERELPYKILLAKVNYEYEGLDYEIRQECSVELLDMRVQAASLVYQSSLSLLYLKAIHDVLGAVDVDIENALNKGLYTEIKRDVPVNCKRGTADSAADGGFGARGSSADEGGAQQRGSHRVF